MRSSSGSETLPCSSRSRKISSARSALLSVRGGWSSLPGTGAKISGAYIGPFTSIGDNVTLRETEIEHSIVLEGATITDIANRIEDSLIGRNVSIYRLPVRPSAYRFMLGDNSEVGIRW